MRNPLKESSSAMLLDNNGAVARIFKKSKILRPLGVSTYRLMRSMQRPSGGPVVVVNSLPKAGTHLAMSLMDAIPGMAFSGRHVNMTEFDANGAHREEFEGLVFSEISKVRGGQYITTHLAYTPEIARYLQDPRVRCVHILRDPRAIVVSLARYMRSYEAHNLFETVQTRYPDDADLYTAVIEGFDAVGLDRGCVSMRARLEQFQPWLSQAGHLALRFEELVGPRGGGVGHLQATRVSEVSHFIGLDIAADRAQQVADSVFDTRSATFRQGDVDGWRSHLSADHLKLLSDSCADVAAQLGYALD